MSLVVVLDLDLLYGDVFLPEVGQTDDGLWLVQHGHVDTVAG